MRNGTQITHSSEIGVSGYKDVEYFVRLRSEFPFFYANILSSEVTVDDDVIFILIDNTVHLYVIIPYSPHTPTENIILSWKPNC